MSKPTPRGVREMTTGKVSGSVVDELWALRMAAAQGEWTVIHGTEVNTPKGVVAYCEDTNHIGEGEMSAALIAGAVNALPDLLHIAEAARLHVNGTSGSGADLSFDVLRQALQRLENLR